MSVTRSVTARAVQFGTDKPNPICRKGLNPYAKVYKSVKPTQLSGMLVDDCVKVSGRYLDSAGNGSVCEDPHEFPCVISNGGENSIVDAGQSGQSGVAPPSHAPAQTSQSADSSQTLPRADTPTPRLVQSTQSNASPPNSTVDRTSSEGEVSGSNTCTRSAGRSIDCTAGGSLVTE